MVGGEGPYPFDVPEESVHTYLRARGMAVRQRIGGDGDKSTRLFLLHLLLLLFVRGEVNVPKPDGRV